MVLITMTNKFKQARVKAGLSVNDCAKLLRLKDPHSLRRWELDESKSTYRSAPEWAFAILDWYTRGVKPEL